jgi:hypothetical protein
VPADRGRRLVPEGGAAPQAAGGQQGARDTGVSGGSPPVTPSPGASDSSTHRHAAFTEYFGCPPILSKPPAERSLDRPQAAKPLAFELRKDFYEARRGTVCDAFGLIWLRNIYFE